MSLPNLGIIINIMCAITGLVYFRLFPPAFKLIALHVCVGLIADVTGSIIGHRTGSNFWVYNLYAVTEVWIIAAVLIYCLRHLWMLIGLLAVSLTVFWLVTVLRSGLVELFVYFHILLPLVYLPFFILLLFKFSRSDLPFFKVPEVWFVLGYVIFYSGTLPVFGMYNFLVRSDSVMSFNLSAIIPFLAIVFYLFIGVSFVLKARARRRAGIPT